MEDRFIHREKMWGYVLILAESAFCCFICYHKVQKFYNFSHLANQKNKIIEQNSKFFERSKATKKIDSFSVSFSVYGFWKKNFKIVNAQNLGSHEVSTIGWVLQ